MPVELLKSIESAGEPAVSLLATGKKPSSGPILRTKAVALARTVENLHHAPFYAVPAESLQVSLNRINF